MITFQGKGVYNAIAIGRAAVFKRQDAQVRPVRIADADAEFTRLERAKKKATEQLSAILEKAIKEVGAENARIFEIHMMMIEDEDYNDSIQNLIKTQSVNAEYAVAATADNFSAMFAAMNDSYMRARAADVKDISDRIIACLSDGEPTENISALWQEHTDKIIVCADDLSPSETVSLDRKRLLAFVTARGSANSHTAILAKSMNIPAVIGVGKEFLSSVKDGDTIIADGHTGTIILSPDEQTKTAMQAKMAGDVEKKKLLQELKGKENVTLDGTKVNIYANIGSVDDVASALANDAGGIGLFRSEFLYLKSGDYPTEEEQFTAYRKVLECMGDKQVIIRTLDIGADKQIDYFHLEKEKNPALGLRGIRLCLTRPEVFKTQLRALYRASVFGNLGILFPMITSVSETEKILACRNEVKEELKKRVSSVSGRDKTRHYD